MQRIMIAFTTVVLLVMIGCSSSSNSGGISVAYNAVYGVNAFSADENISLYVGDEVIETVLPYDQNASIIEKAVGNENVVFYTTVSSGALGHTPLQLSRTYFYAATDCTDKDATQKYELVHMVETDMQIKIANTSSDLVLRDDINISIGGTRINEDIPACVITPMLDASTQDQNISVSIDGSFSVWKIAPSDVNTSVTIVIYGTAPQEAAIILLPRLTSDAL